MSATSPPLEPPIAATPPSTSDTPPPVAATPPPSSNLNSPPPVPPTAPPPQANTPPPQANTPPPQANTPSPQPPVIDSPPPQSPPNSVDPPPPMASPPPIVNPPPPITNGPPPIVNAPPLVVNAPPPLPPSPPPSAPPPANSPPPPTPSITPTSPPPPVVNPRPPPSDPPTSPPPPVVNPQPPPSDPPTSPPPPVINPPPPPPRPTPSNPPTSPPPPVINPRPPPPRPRNNAPPPPTAIPPTPPPPRQPPNNSPPPNPPENSPPPPPVVPPFRPATPPAPSRSSSPPPTSNSPPLSPPPSVIPSPPFSPPPPSNTNTNSSVGNAPEVSQSSSGGGIGNGGTVGIAVGLSLLLLGLIGILACFVCKRKKRSSGHNVGHIMPTSVNSSRASDSGLLKMQISQPNNGSGSSGLGNSRSWFTFNELVDATDGFSAQKLLGEGGFGCVYKGSLADGREVAVKLLKSAGGQGEREFKSEVEIISRVHHRHLVSLVGYCISDDRRLLVFDYLPNNTLYFHLHGEGQPVMDWARRVKIAVGAARGISYLHEDCHPRIIHRDIKSSNILLDSNFEARVSDFGLAKLAMDANTHISTRVMGTFGYMAPEYASSGKLTEKSDVYSFGVVLLELTTGRKPVDTSQPLGEESLVEWARPLLSDALETQEFGVLADPRLDGSYVDGEMLMLIEAAAACVRHSSAKRPTMGQVVRAFDSLATSDLTNGMRVGESEIFNSAQQSEEIRLFQRMAFGSQGYSTDFFSQNTRASQDYGNPETNR